MKIIGLTGSIATGKTTASTYLKNQGYAVIETDRIYHDLLKPKKAAWQAIVEHFGPEFLTEDAEIDRKKLGQLVFSDQAARMKLNQISHPIILEEVKRQIESHRAEKLVFLDVPLLFESKWENNCDLVWVIAAPNDLQLAWLMKRNNLTLEEAKSRINAQMSQAEKIQKADAVIWNKSSIEEFEKAIEMQLRRSV
ncbi:MAG: dephospho-CoA kinase [Lactobacillus sp.]|nr:dephospho-CoA kinase [Lactobacillus sp.]